MPFLPVLWVYCTIGHDARHSSNSLFSDMRGRLRLLHWNGPHVRECKERMMMKALWPLMGMIAMSANANERPPDPVAWSCHMCTEEERQSVALGRGEGQHFVYSLTNWYSLHGYEVTRQEGGLVVRGFTPPNWITNQYREFMEDFNESRGGFVHNWTYFEVYPPGSPHVLSNTIMWGHHVSSLNPRHEEAREIMRRILNNTTTFNFLKADAYGRILHFDFQLDGTAPYIARLQVGGVGLGAMEFYFDMESRSWEYLRSMDYHTYIQESPEDFLAADGGPRSFNYRTYYQGQSYFMQRAKWAGVKMHGELSGHRPTGFDCSRRDGDIHCFVIHL